MSRRHESGWVCAACAVLVFAGGCAGRLVADKGTGAEGAGGSGSSASSASTSKQTASTGSEQVGSGTTSSSGPTTTTGSSTAEESLCETPLPIPDATPWPGNPEDCADIEPGESLCNAPSDLTCFYNVESSLTLVGCACAYDSTLEGMRWHCVDAVTDFDTRRCPELMPESESSCADQGTSECEYPIGTLCTCPRDDEDPRWSCKEIREAPASRAPADVKATTLVSELTDVARSNVCAWIASVGGVSDAATVAEDGYTIGNACRYGWEPTKQALFPGVSEQQCASNLALSNCDATVGELAECVMAFSGFDYGASCGHYLEHDGCSGTVVVAHDCSADLLVNEACRIQVE